MAAIPGKWKSLVNTRFCWTGQWTLQWGCASIGNSAPRLGIWFGVSPLFPPQTTFDHFCLYPGSQCESGKHPKLRTGPGVWEVPTRSRTREPQGLLAPLGPRCHKQPQNVSPTRKSSASECSVCFPQLGQSGTRPPIPVSYYSRAKKKPKM